MGQVTGLRVKEALPGPGEDVRVVAANLEDAGAGQPFPGVAAVEEGVEGLSAPALQGVQNVLGVRGFGGERGSRGSPPDTSAVRA